MGIRFPRFQMQFLTPRHHEQLHDIANKAYRDEDLSPDDDKQLRRIAALFVDNLSKDQSSSMVERAFLAGRKSLNFEPSAARIIDSMIVACRGGHRV